MSFNLRFLLQRTYGAYVGADSVDIVSQYLRGIVSGVCVCFVSLQDPVSIQRLSKYRQVSNISCTKSQNLKDSRTGLRLSLPSPLKPDVKSRMKM